MNPKKLATTEYAVVGALTFIVFMVLFKTPEKAPDYIYLAVTAVSLLIVFIFLTVLFTIHGIIMRLLNHFSPKSEHNVEK